MPVIWITGLSGAGKTTLAQKTADVPRADRSSPIVLDGDVLRDVFDASTFESNHHSREASLSLAFQYSRLCKLLSDQNQLVIIATISLFHEVHDWNRSNIKGYFEVYLKVPVAELERRDPKQIYSRFRAGALRNVAGLDLQVDEPTNADWLVEFTPGQDINVIATELATDLALH